MTETMAPEFVTPQRTVHRPYTVSIVGTGRPLSEGIRLHHNRDRYGFFLNKEIEGFGLAPVENTTQPKATGGSSLRFRRWAEGEMFLPISLISPSPASLYDMFARLVETVTGQDGYFDVVYFDPYSQEPRRRTVLYDGGLESPNEAIPHLKHVVGITGKVLDPFWRGPERVVTERIAPPVKPLITADPGSPVNRWDDPEFSDTVAYEPWFVVDGGLEKQGTGAEHGVFVSGHRIEVNPGETVSVSAGLSYVDGPNVGDIQVRVRAYDADSTLVTGSEQTVIAESYAGTYTGTYVVPTTGSEIELGFYTASDVHANTRVRIENLNVQRDVQYLARYEWEGEPHNSPSIKIRDGQAIARNKAVNPRAENGTTGWLPQGGNSLESVESQGFGVSSSRIFKVENESGLNARSRSVPYDTPDSGGWIGVSVWLAHSYASQLPSIRGDVEVRFHAPGGGTAYRTLPSVYASFTDGAVISGAFEVPEGYEGGTFDVNPRAIRSSGDWSGQTVTMYYSNVQVVAAESEQAALDQVAEYFDGDTPDVVDEGSLEGAYSFPFFPVFLADSTVQGEHELRVEGDAPVWPVWEITGPGRDVEIIGPDGSRLFVEGEVSSPITIVTEPGKRSIRDASGLIWDRMKPGDDQFFALEPGEQVVRMTMVGGNPESTIKAVYSENWKTPRGTAQGMIRGGVV